MDITFIYEELIEAYKSDDFEKFNQINSQFNLDFSAEYSVALKKKGKYLDFDGKTLKIKPEYLFVQNDIILEFMK